MTASPKPVQSWAQSLLTIAFGGQGPRWGVLAVLALLLGSIAVAYSTHLVDAQTASAATASVVALIVTELRRPPPDAGTALIVALGAHYVGSLVGGAL